MSEENEIWCDVVGYEGVYQISNTGKVKSLYLRTGSAEVARDLIMTPTDNGNGYLIVGFKLNGKRKNRYVHDLVAECFISKRPKGFVVNHIDHNKKNNNVENLEWCTQKQNVLHSVHLMRKPRSKFKRSNTGRKHIHRTKSGSFRVCFKKIGEKRFSELDDAIKYRNEGLLKYYGYDYMRTVR